jgi:hypothetical protein
VQEEAKNKDGLIAQPVGSRGHPGALGDIADLAHDSGELFVGQKESDPPAGHEGRVAVAFPEGSQPLDFSVPFTKAANASSSFQPREIRGTRLRKFLEALPVPAFLTDRSAHAPYAKQACGPISKQCEKGIGRPFSSLLPDKSAAARAHSAKVGDIKKNVTDIRVHGPPRDSV